MCRHAASKNVESGFRIELNRNFDFTVIEVLTKYEKGIIIGKFNI